MTSAAVPVHHVPNAKRLLWAGFTAILAAGVGFAIRNGILDNWGREYGFSATQQGVISGQGLTGFCFGIILGGIVADRIGYGKLVIAAFLFHVISAVITFLPTPETNPDTAYLYLFWGTFLFAVANGTLEAVANPLIATLFPENRTHYLNILHASWPAGLIIGGALGWVLDDQYEWPWKWQLGLFLLPTVVYGLMFLGQKMPQSEASSKGLSLGEMLKDVGILGGLVMSYFLSLFLGSVLASSALFPENSPLPSYIGYGLGALVLVGVAVSTKFSLGSWLLFVLFLTHAMVGAVELGTDTWIQNITGNILSSGEGKILFVFTSALMFGLRFCADFIEKKAGLSPLGILFTCAVLACVGLNLCSAISSFGFALGALAVYALGKTFFWPTMLAVASDRFPRSGAVAISIMGGIGMMSAGLVGAPGLGYFKDRYSGEALQTANASLYTEYKSEKGSKFLVFPEVYGLDSKKLDRAAEAKKASGPAVLTEKFGVDVEGANKLIVEAPTVLEASIAGDRKTLVTDSVIPATMAVIFLALLLYFRSIGGYRPLAIDEQQG